MAFVTKSFNGQITGLATQSLYAVPPSKSAIVTSMRFVNANVYGPTPTLNLGVVPSGGPEHPIYFKDFTIAVTTSAIIDDPLTLGSGDMVRLTVPSSPSPLIDWELNVLERE